MGIWRRLRNLWELSQVEIPAEEVAPALFRKQEEKAEFLMPNRVEEIIRLKPGVSIDEVLQ